MATGRVPTTANSPLTAKGDLFGYSTTQARVAVGNDGETLVADSSTSTGLRYQGSMAAGKNLIINGGFDIWQRGTGSIALGALGDYTADRWQGYRGPGSTSTVSRQVTGDTTNLPFIQYCARVQRNSGNTSTASILFVNSSETINSIPYAGKSITFSFYARAGANFSATSSQLTVQLQTGTGTDQNALMTGYTGLTNAVNSTATLTTTWQRFTYTATLGATITEIAPYFTFAPTGTAGANDYYEITGVQVEIGSVATNFTRAGGTIQGELAACQRYYQRINTIGNTYALLASGFANSTTQSLMTVPFKTVMRTTPTSIGYGGTVRLSDGPNLATVSSISIDTALSNESNLGFFVNSSGLTQFRPYILRGENSASAYLEMTAEL